MCLIDGEDARDDVRPFAGGAGPVMVAKEAEGWGGGPAGEIRGGWGKVVESVYPPPPPPPLAKNLRLAVSAGGRPPDKNLRLAVSPDSNWLRT